MGNQTKIIFTAIVFFLCNISNLLAAPKPGMPIFTDNFDTPATFAENWVANGAKSLNGQMVIRGGTPNLRIDLPLEFYVECDVALRNKKQQLGHGGIMIGSYRFQIQSNGKAFLIAKDIGGKSIVNYAPISEYEMGRPVRISIARTVDNDLATYTYFINGKTYGSFRQNLPDKGKDNKLVISGDVEKITIDNFCLSSVKKSDNESPNLTVNSSFEELQDGFPLYVTRFFYTMNFSLGKQFDYDQYIASVSADQFEKHSGNYSLKLVVNKYALRHEIGFHSTGKVEGKPGVMSLWMKSDRDDMKVQFNYTYGQYSQVFNVGKEWKRYETVIPKLQKPNLWPGASLLVRSDFNKDGGTLWVDDVQCEILATAPTEEDIKSGKTFATPYRPSEIDKTKFGPEPKNARAPSFAVPALPSGIKPSVDLDAWKSYATKVDDFHYTNKTPKNKTEVFLACDKDNLYVGYRNFGDELAFYKKEPSLFTHGVEFFFAPSETDKKFLHFAANATGDKRAYGLGEDPTCDIEWRCNAVENKTYGSVDYLVTIPMGNFADINLSANWLINLCRNDSVAKEHIALPSIPRVMYKSVDTWARVSFPDEIIRANSIGVDKVTIVDISGNRQLGLDVKNSTGIKQDIKIKAINLTEGKKVIAEKEIAVPEEGKAEVLSPINGSAKKIAVSFRDSAGKLLFNRNLIPAEEKSVSVLGRLSFYMNEPEAIFRCNVNIPNAEKHQALLTCAGKQVKIPAAEKFTINFPLSDVKPGTYDAELSIIDGERKVARTAIPLIKREFRENATQINHFSRSVVVNGKPLFMFAPFLGDFNHSHIFTADTAVKMLEIFDRYGFNSMHFLLDPQNEKAITSANAFLSTADKKNLSSMIWIKNHDMKNPDFEKVITRVGGKNIISYQVLDEPELCVTAEWTLAYLRKHRGFFPYHPMHMNNTVLGIPNNFANLETDILMLDDYLTNGEKRTVYSVIHMADLMWEIGKEKGTPCYFFLVDNNWPLHHREPSYAEQIAQCYGAIASGCTGISLFFGWAQTPGNWKASVQLSKETTVLNDVLTSEEECEDATSTGESKYLRCRTKKYNGYLYLVTCNIDSTPANQITFTLPSSYEYEGQVDVMFEDRQCEIKEGKFIDNFDKWSRHVYRIKMK